MTHWINQAIFYHIYPLGLCGAPFNNPNTQPAIERLERVFPWLDHIAGLGFNALYLGPLFESLSHGYDTTDYFHLDRRLGNNQTLKNVIDAAHQRGIHVILDAVFNHVGREFFAFKDVLEKRSASPYCGWFSGLRFDGNNGYQDGFRYDSWEGYENLVKLDLTHPQVRSHLFEAVRMWIEEFQIDGLRLDAANVMDHSFLSELAHCSKALKPDFWLVGEVIAGDYHQWANPDRLDSVTNYEAFKGLYSSFNDHNFFEIAWTLNRQFGDDGLYRGLPLYNFADNHDVSRVASLLRNPAHLLPLYTLLFSMPGVPSIYYGSEFGIKGLKENGDPGLRPELELQQLYENPEQAGVMRSLQNLILARKELPALQFGQYRRLVLTNEQLAFSREWDSGLTVTALNCADQPAHLEIPLPGRLDAHFYDYLNPDRQYPAAGGMLHLELAANSACLLAPR